MRLHEWLDKQGRGAKTRLCKEADVAWSTVDELYREARLVVTHAMARRISAATGGGDPVHCATCRCCDHQGRAVSIAELCESRPEPKAKRRTKRRAA